MNRVSCLSDLQAAFISERKGNLDMYVVATSVFLLFALIFLGFFIGKRQIVRQECTPDLSNFILKITMPVTVFCSIVDQQGSGMLSSCAQILAAVIVLHAVSGLIGLLLVQVLPIPEKEKGIWIYTCMFSNNGFMGLPLALSIYGSEGMFLMALSNVVTNFLIFSVGVKLLTWKYPCDETISFRKMVLNNINIAVVIGFIFCFFHIPVPELADKLLTYISNITSGLSMIVVGLSLSRLPFKAVFEDKKMFLLAGMRLLILPLIVIAVLRLLSVQIDGTLVSVLILTAALPASSAQSMIAEQYGTNTSAAGRSVFITTLFSVITVPVVMLMLNV